MTTHDGPHEGSRPRAGWAPFLHEGRRVVLRYAIDAESSPHGESMTDALGTIVGSDEAAVRVMTRRGEVRVPRALVIAAKEVPPPPVRPRGPAGP
ncbi:MAG: putative acetyltransferase [Brachybacterium sp.]|uniref:putative acetyltransferase n=1 Tax=Brachybacterium sp. TaxID=1891286 RepID=UPI00264DC82F|nr:acetyltransferase [Brachybacterium sp.]MDN6301826.1 acetyltransferase [Brachybacterium sp.]MDN6327777.1 acetyltransferase [Brachybacterium sp.]MDN6399559.1 acetyltransferase [Brachybacterium sp.]